MAIANEFSGAHTMVVTGRHHEMLLPYLSTVKYSQNARWSEGMGTSISHGIQEILKQDPDVNGIVILPIDQPLVTAQHLRDQVRLGQNSQRCALTASGPIIGPPAYIPKAFFHLALSLKGDHGLKSILSPSQWIALESQSALTDIDTPTQLQELSQKLSLEAPEPKLKNAGNRSPVPARVPPATMSCLAK